jgi:CRP/FNR family transcriptional regulator
LTLKKNYGLEADQETINVKVKREELANLAGTTRETASRILFDLRDKKVIELVGKKIKILDFSMLKDLAKAIQ